jgi:hypothetical protein
MKFSMSANGIHLVRLGAVVAAVAGLIAASAVGCDTGNQGDRCNPNLSHNECGGGLVCLTAQTMPPLVDCPEAYCCPSDLSQATSNFCQPGCAGGAFSIITASCSTSSPNPLCACFAGASPLLPSNIQVDAGPECECFATDPDPIAHCMGASGGDSGSPDTGGGGDAGGDATEDTTSPPPDTGTADTGTPDSGAADTGTSPDTGAADAPADSPPG